MPRAKAGEITKARKVVYARDGHWCQMCGESIVDRPSSTHHRINKGAGGSALLERPSLLVRLCGLGSNTVTSGCHDWIGRNPQEAAERGWLLPKNNPDIDPEREPILTIQGWVLLDDAGVRFSLTEGRAV